MMTHQVLNRARPRTLLLVHGLNTTAGYWLPYLAALRQFRLILLNIDYAHIDALPDYVAAVEAIIADTAGGQVDGVIAHSLGCLIAHQLPAPRRRISFEICPVYCARALRVEQFIAELGERSGAPAAAGLQQRLTAIGRTLAATGAHPDATAIQYLPDADRYFSYHGQATARHFAGDHFDITAAIAAIADQLA